MKRTNISNDKSHILYPDLDPRRLKFDVNRNLIEVKKCPNCNHLFEKHEFEIDI